MVQRGKLAFCPAGRSRIGGRLSCLSTELQAGGVGKSESALINPSIPTGLGDGSVPVHYTFRLRSGGERNEIV